MKIKITLITLVFSLIVFLFVGCSSKGDDTKIKSGVINKAEVVMPKESDAQIITEITGALSVNSYLVARVYLDQFLSYDIHNGTLEEYQSLLSNTIEAFENAKKLSEALIQTVDFWMSQNDLSDEKPSYKLLGLNKNHLSDLFKVYADEEDSPAVKWAKDITNLYDKAPTGKGIRTLAEHLNTDAKRAYAQLCQAQDILQGAEYSNIAETANKAYQTASVLKTAGTAAGLVVSIVAAPATTTLGAVINTGGIVVGGINTVMEIGSTGTILYTNGEGNWVTKAIEETKKDFSPIGDIIGLAGVCTNVTNIWKTQEEIYKRGGNVLKDSATEKIADDVLGILSFGGNLFEAFEVDSSMTGFSVHNTDTSKKYQIFDVPCAVSDKEKNEVKEMFKEMGLDKDTIDIVFDDEQTTKDETDETNESDIQDFSDNIAVKILKSSPGLDPGNEGFDVDTFIEGLQDYIYTENPNNPSVSLITPDTVYESSDMGDISGLISGEYTMTLVNGEGLTDVVAAEVVLHDDGTMEISFTPHAVVFNDSSGFVIDENNFSAAEHLVGSFDIQTNSFTGIGDVYSEPVQKGGFTIPTTTYWNMVETVIVFDYETNTATGVMGAELTGLEAAMTTEITMVKNE